MNRSPGRCRCATFLLPSICAALAAVWLSSAAAYADLPVHSGFVRGGGDEVLLINARGLGSTRDPEQIAAGLRCERFVRSSRGTLQWTTAQWSEVLQRLQRPLPTVVFVHGNRVERGEDRAIGLSVYRKLDRISTIRTPKRLIIWSWPASKIPGPVRDFKLKSARTAAAGWQLAWALSQLPETSPASLIAYSLGARVATGTLHVLAGGELAGAALPSEARVARRRMDVVLVSAAVNADWLRPRGPHGQCLRQVNRMVLVTNHMDPAMRFYRWGPTGRGAQALGFAGPLGISGFSQYAERVLPIDATDSVGRTHELEVYLGATPGIDGVLRQMASGRPVGGSVQSLPVPLAGRASSSAY